MGVMRTKLLYTIVACLCVAPVAFGDTLTLNNGSVKQGTIISENEDEVTFRVVDGGMSMNMTVPKSNVKKLERGPLKETEPVAPKPAPAVSLGTPDAATRPGAAGAATKPAVIATVKPAGKITSHGFLGELGASMVGLGPNSPLRLPPEIQPLWNQAMKADTEGRKAETLEYLRAMEGSMRDVDGGISRLDAVSRLVREESFGLWMARIHWDQVFLVAKTGRLDLNDVREVERGPMIGLLKEATGPALDPLKSYFPPINDKGVQEPFKATQLSGLTITNAIEVKEQATLAWTILQAQLKLEPKMSAADRQTLTNAAQNVNRVRNRAAELEPLAKAALAKAEKDKKAAEDRARRLGGTPPAPR